MLTMMSVAPNARNAMTMWVKPNRERVAAVSWMRTTMGMVKQIVPILIVVSMDTVGISVEKKLDECASTEKIMIKTVLLIVMILIVGKIRVLPGNVGVPRPVRNALTEKTMTMIIR